MISRDVTALTVDQLYDLTVLSDDIISIMTAVDELRRRGLPLTRDGDFR